MSSLFDRATSKSDVFGEAFKAIKPYIKEYPRICEVLGGNKDGADGIDRQPGSVRIFTNGGEVKAELSGPEWLMRGFVVFPKGNFTLAALEEELSAGRIGWAVKTEQKNSYTKAPY